MEDSDFNQKIESIKDKNLRIQTSVPHYYGDTIRKIFLAVGVIMLATLPFFKEFVEMPVYLSILAIVILALISGLTNPRQKWVNALNLIVSIVGLMQFGHMAVTKYGIDPAAFVLTNLLIGILFLASLYFSAKTLRGFFVFGSPK